MRKTKVNLFFCSNCLEMQLHTHAKGEEAGCQENSMKKVHLLHLPSKTILLSLLISNKRLSREDCSLLSPRKPNAVFFWALLLNQSTSQIPILSMICESLGGSSLYTCHTAPCLPVHGNFLSFQKLRTDLFTKARLLQKPSSTSGVHVTTKQGAKLSCPTLLETQ